MSGAAIATLLRSVGASGPDRIAEFPRVLEQLASNLGGDACILWQSAAPGRDPRVPVHGMFVLTQWSRAGAACVLYRLPVEHSLTGTAAVTGSVLSAPDALHDERVFTSDGYFEKNGVTAMCAASVEFADGATGALSLYWRARDPLEIQNKQAVDDAATVVPLVYEATSSKESLSLVQNVLGTLYPHGAALPTDRKPESVIGHVARLISECFECLETSFFLRDEAGLFRRIASTWPPEQTDTPFRPDGRGLTSWVLHENTPVLVFDLSRFSADAESIQAAYPGIAWNGSADEVYGHLKRTGHAAATEWPITFMAAPIAKGDDVLGVVRCSIAAGRPRFFSQRDLRLLALVAAPVAHYWVDTLARRAVETENASWRAFVDGASQLNRFAQAELSTAAPDERRVFMRALALAERVFPMASTFAIRLVDAPTHTLHFVMTHGDAWNKGTPREIDERMNRRFSLSSGGQRHESIGAYVFNTGNVYFSPDAEKLDADITYVETFPDTAQLLVVPVGVEKDRIGVLDIRTVGDRPLPLHAPEIAELLGQQIGLYHALTSKLSELRAAEAELKMYVATQQQSFEDFEHQLRGPILQALTRVQAAIRLDMSVDRDRDRARSELGAVRGLLAKARRVAMNLRVFVVLAQGKLDALPCQILPTTVDSFQRLMIEAATDAELLSDPAHDVRFLVERRSFESLGRLEAFADTALVEQVIGAVLDNAAKYSFPSTVVRIGASKTGRARFQLTVASEGQALRPSEINKAVMRGWRSDIAVLVTGEGAGIGLWIADHLMRRLGGELIIVPTTPDDITEVKLVFPVVGL